MGYPKAYEPIYGQKYQILFRCKGERSFEHLDYAEDHQEKTYLMREHSLAYRGMGIELKSILLPMKYWKKPH